jgi:hypothetical protein
MHLSIPVSIMNSYLADNFMLTKDKLSEQWVTYQQDGYRRSKVGRLEFRFQWQHGRKYILRQDERLLYVSFGPEVFNVLNMWANIRHEQRGPLTAFSVSALSQVQ